MQKEIYLDRIMLTTNDITMGYYSMFGFDTEALSLVWESKNNKESRDMLLWNLFSKCPVVIDIMTTTKPIWIM